VTLIFSLLFKKDFQMATTKKAVTEVTQPKSEMPTSRYKEQKLTSKTIIFTGPKAKEWIEKYEGPNRPKGVADVKRYAGMMAAGKWALTHQGIAITTEEKLVDGQHRLDAIVYAYEVLGVDVKIPIRVTFGLDAEIFEILDQGRLRKAKDAFSIEGYAHPNILDIAVRLHWIRCNGRNVKGTGKLSIAEMKDHLKANPILETAANFIMDELETPMKSYISPGYATALCALQMKAGETYKVSDDEMANYVKEFWKKFVDDDVENELSVCDSPRIVRKYIQKCAADKDMSLDRDALVNILIAAFNAFLEGEEVKTLKDFKPLKGERAVLGGLDFDPDETDE